MSSTTISQLPLAASLSGAELMLGQQSGTTVAITTLQVAQLANITGSAAAGPNGAVQFATASVLTGVAAFSYSSGLQTLSVPNLSVSAAITGGSFSGTTVGASGAITSSVSVTPSQTTAAFNYGSLTYSDVNNLANFELSNNNHVQVTVQNPSTAAAASADFIVANSATTATTEYGDFGINSTGFTGTGSLNAAGYVFLSSTSVDIAIGTTTSNAIHFVVNSGATDAMSISSAGVTTIANATISAGSFSGAVSATTLSASSTVTLNGAGAAISLAPTGAGSVTINPATAGTINNMAIGGTTPAAGSFTGVTVTSATIQTNGIYLGAASTLSFSTASTARGSINASGTWSIAATAGGSSTPGLAIAVPAVASSYGIVVTAASTGTSAISICGNATTPGAADLQFYQTGAGVGWINNLASANLNIQSASGSSIHFFAGALDRGYWGNSGGMVINAPTSGNALNVAGVAGSTAVVITPAAATIGLSIAAGATTAYAASINGGTGAVPLYLVNNQSVGSPAFRADNSTVTVSTGTGTVLCRNSTSANNTGWLAVNLDATVRYIPYWS